MSNLANTIIAQLEDIKRATLLGVKDTLTVEECALLTGYSVSSLYTYTCKRVIPHFKRGNSVFFSKQAIETWMRGQPVATEEELTQEAATYIATKKQR